MRENKRAAAGGGERNERLGEGEIKVQEGVVDVRMMKTERSGGHGAFSITTQG